MLLNMNSSKDETIQISLYDMMGKSYITPINKNIISGENQINLDTQLPIYRGVYIVRITEQSGKTSTKKIFID
jgi:phage-related protein